MFRDTTYQIRQDCSVFFSHFLCNGAEDVASFSNIVMYSFYQQYTGYDCSAHLNSIKRLGQLSLAAGVRICN